MIHFRPLTDEDIPLIQSYTQNGGRRGCDISVANLIGWQFLFNTQIAELEGYLVLRMNFFDRLAYLMPIAKPRQREDGTFEDKACDECDVRVIKALLDDSASLGQPFLMSGVSSHMAEVLEKTMPGVFSVDSNRDYADYVYTREKLSNLSGKKLQSKRNHINKFLNLYPDYEYKPLVKEMIPACLRLEQQWKEFRNESEPMGGHNIELRAITRCFHRWDQLGLVGGTIWVKGELVAFTYGCPVSRDTFDVCVEKANLNYEGAFTIINREFVRHLPEQYVFINREEDMGEEGLRKAKLSYHPDILLEKCLVREKSSGRQQEDEQSIRKECMQLWRDTFNDPEEYVQIYFSRLYRSENNMCVKEAGKVVAALQTIPFTMLFGDEEASAAYVSGVAVKDEFRGQDIGTELMRQAHFNLYNRKVAFAVLIPAEQWLREWYGRLGYSSCIQCIEPPAGAAGMSYEEWSAEQRKQHCTLLAGREWFEVAQEELRRSGGTAPAPVTGMLRIIDAFQALNLYAHLHPEAEMKLRITDDEVIPANNVYFTVSAGTVIQSEEPDEKALKITIASLAELIFREMDATMTLMLN